MIESNGNELNILIAAFAGAVVGGIFTLIGAIFQYKINKRHLKIQILHANKLNELMNFQNAIVEVLSVLPSLGLLMYDKNIKANYDRDNYQLQFDRIYSKLTNIKHRIPFLIDINDSEHIKLYKLIGDIFYTYEDFKPFDFKDWEIKTIKLSQDIANLGVNIYNIQKKKLEKEFFG